MQQLLVAAGTAAAVAAARGSAVVCQTSAAAAGCGRVAETRQKNRYCFFLIQCQAFNFLLLQRGDAAESKATFKSTLVC